jgi:hypothetical protein
MSNTRPLPVSSSAPSFRCGVLHQPRQPGERRGTLRRAFEIETVWHIPAADEGAAIHRGANMIRNTAASIVLAASVTVAALTPATEVRAATKFDGSWSVVVFTRNGPCDAAYRLSGQIINGAIVYNGIGSVAIAGRVRPNGAASLRVSSGEGYAVASGHMTATHGSGSWYGRTSQGRCSGSWTAGRS